MSTDYPILEFDPTREAMVEPSRVIQPQDVPEHCVICFFKEVLDEVVIEMQAILVADNAWSDGPHPIYEIFFHGQRLAFFHPGIGASLAAGLLEEAIARGCKKFIVCGGCGVLEKDIAVGHLIVVSSAVREEGVSYHYLSPSREVQANPAGVNALVVTLEKRGLPYRVGKTWTIDAPYRETVRKVAARRQEGCMTVEMEAAALMAVAEYRRVLLGQVLYGGDDLSGSEWDNRGWQDRREVRRNLFWLAAEACLSL
jgi:uridine phosphorylase